MNSTTQTPTSPTSFTSSPPTSPISPTSTMNRNASLEITQVNQNTNLKAGKYTMTSTTYMGSTGAPHTRAQSIYEQEFKIRRSYTPSVHTVGRHSSQWLFNREGWKKFLGVGSNGQNAKPNPSGPYF